MPKQVKEIEEELDINVKKDEKSSYAVRFFRDYAVNNAEELKIVCDLTSRSAEEQFCMYLEKGNTEIYAVVFYATFISILEFLRERQKQYNNFTIAIANSINIGYTNNDDENNEKVGNFMPIMEHIGINMNYIDPDSEIKLDKTSSNCIEWKLLNIKKNTEYFKEIQEKAFDKLKREYKTNIRTSEAVIPLFCIFMDHICNVLKMKYQEAIGTDSVSETSINVMGLFDIYYSFNEEENLEIWDFTPNIRLKLELKSDSVAGRE